jgi:hypothetical protein
MNDRHLISLDMESCGLDRGCDVPDMLYDRPERVTGDLTVAASPADLPRIERELLKEGLSLSVMRELDEGQPPILIVGTDRTEDAMRALSAIALSGPVGIVLDMTPETGEKDFADLHRLIAMPDPVPLALLTTREDALRECAELMDRMFGPSRTPPQTAVVPEPKDVMDRLFGDHVLDREMRRRSSYVLRDDRRELGRALAHAAMAAGLPERSGFDYRSANSAPRSQRRKRR